MRFTALTAFAVLSALAAFLPQQLTAQNDETEGQAAEEKQYRGPLPFYFGKLGLSEPQKVKLYAIQDSYEERIDALRKQIEGLESERDESMETLLTPGQKLRLQELREEARLNEEARLREEARQAAPRDVSDEAVP